MEHFLRHHEGKLTALLAAAFLLAAPVSAESAAGSSDAGSSTLDFANGLYARKMYGPAIAEYDKFIRSNPASPELASARFRYADSYYFTKNYRSAIDYFETFVRDFPRDKRAPLALFRIGTSRYYLGAHAEAVRAFVRASKEAEDPNVRAGALFFLGKSYEAGGKPEQAVGIYRQLAQGYPQIDYASYAAVSLGDYHLARKEYETAAAAYRVAADKSNPAEVAREARFKIAEIRFQLQDYDGASAAYAKLIEELPRGVDARAGDLRDKALFGLFYCDYHRGDLDAAVRRFEENRADVAAGDHEPEILFLLAALHADKGGKAQALEKIEAVLAHPGTDPDLRERASFKKSAVLAAAGEAGPALAELENIKGSTPEAKARALFEKGKVMEALGRRQEALALYRQVADAHGTTEYAKAALYQAGVAGLALGRPGAAEADFLAFAEKYPDDEAADQAILEAVQIELDAKDFAAAAARLKKFLERYPKSDLLDIASYKLGIAATGLKKYDEAFQAFARVANGDPKSKVYVEALYGAAVSRENAGSLAEALPYYERIVAFHPDHPLADDVLARLGFIYIKTGEYEKMKALYEDVLFKKPQIRVNAEGVFWLVRSLLDHGEYADIQRILEALPQRFPDQDFGHEIHFFLGESFMGQKDYPKAIEHYRQAVTYRADGAYAAHAFLGMGIASAASGDRAAAERAFTEALRWDNEVRVATRARFEIAAIRLAEGNLEEAARAFMLVAVLHDDPKYTPQSLYRAAECFTRLGKADEAQKATTELLERYPKSLWAKKAAQQAVAAGKAS